MRPQTSDSSRSETRPRRKRLWAMPSKTRPVGQTREDPAVGLTKYHLTSGVRATSPAITPPHLGICLSENALRGRPRGNTAARPSDGESDRWRPRDGPCELATLSQIIYVWRWLGKCVTGSYKRKDTCTNVHRHWVLKLAVRSAESAPIAGGVQPH